MNTNWLYEKYNNLEEYETISAALIDSTITQSLKYALRPYQEKALQRFTFFMEQETHKANNHLLFEMATGSGKTLVMASFMLYLYKQGYRNFIFFVNSTTIVQKTKANFAEATSSKYLFNNFIELDNQRIKINPIENLDEAQPDSLNVLFTTIQGLHSTLNNEKENAVTFDDLKAYQLVLLADEAHHLNTATRQTEFDLFSSWENTVERIFSSNPDNVLLEMTATADTTNPDIADKYRSKLIYKYSLKEFCDDGFSKTIAMIVNRSDNKSRMLLSLLVSQFRQEIASEHGLSIKPVILFKSEKIKTSEENQQIFINLLENLTEQQIEQIIESAHKNRNNSPLLDEMLQFFADKKLTVDRLLRKLQLNFSSENIINVNNDKEKEEQQILLNTLEESTNKIRIVFAVNKLNEGWDVLNLFDVVKLFETKSKKKTTQETQLIGRGARYFPFTKDDTEQKYMRKFDKERDNPLRFLEELHYHTIDEVEYVRELNKELQDLGLITEENAKEVDFELKDTFKQSEIYQQGIILLNKRVNISERKKRKTSEGKNLLGEKAYTITLPDSQTLNVQLTKNTKIEETEADENNINQGFNRLLNTCIKGIPFPIFYKAVSRNSFFTFDNLHNLLDFTSIKDLYKYLAPTSIAVLYDGNQPPHLTPHDMLEGVTKVLTKLQANLQVSDYRGGAFFPSSIKKIFHAKKVLVNRDKTVQDGTKAEYYAQNQFIGTDEEVSLIEKMNSFLNDNPQYKEAWLLRNEKHFTIYQFNNGKGFEPDFVLFLQDKDNQILTYQLFIEPKGKHLLEYDKWKEDFMKEINQKYPEPFQWSTKEQKVIGLPFYNHEQYKAFLDTLQEKLVR